MSISFCNRCQISVEGRTHQVRDEEGDLYWACDFCDEEAEELPEEES